MASRGVCPTDSATRRGVGSPVATVGYGGLWGHARVFVGPSAPTPARQASPTLSSVASHCLTRPSKGGLDRLRVLNTICIVPVAYGVDGRLTPIFRDFFSRRRGRLMVTLTAKGLSSNVRRTHYYQQGK